MNSWATLNTFLLLMLFVLVASIVYEVSRWIVHRVAYWSKRAEKKR
jgi:hypothetical protein